MNVTRPSNGNCASGTVPCSKFTNSTNSICVTNSNKCPITDVQFVLNADVSKYNTDASVTTSPYYKNQTYTTKVTLLYSTQVNSMPITTFQVGIKPCMAPGTQEGAYFYPTELNDYTTCPIEINSGLRYDPMYVKQSSAAFTTNEYAVEITSGVSSILMSQPSYYWFVGNPIASKKSISLYAWQRATPYWDENCSMSRADAT